MKFVEKTRGAVSIFLIMIMLPMFVLAGGAVDGSRIHSAKVAITGAGDLAMNAALADYETVLKDVYGLFAMSKTVDELEENVSRYFKNTLENASLLGGEATTSQEMINSVVSSLFADGDAPDKTQNVLKAAVDSFSLIPMNNSMLANPDVLERQIVEYMKIRGPVSLGKGLLTKIGCLSDTADQTTAAKKKLQYERKLSSLQEACETAYNAIQAYLDEYNASKYKDKETSTYISELNTSFDNAKSRMKEMTEYIIAHKSDDLNTMNILKSAEETLIDAAKNGFDPNFVNDIYAYTKSDEDVKSLIKGIVYPNGAAATTESAKSGLQKIISKTWSQLASGYNSNNQSIYKGTYYSAVEMEWLGAYSIYSSSQSLRDEVEWLLDYAKADDDKQVEYWTYAIEYLKTHNTLNSLYTGTDPITLSVSGYSPTAAAYRSLLENLIVYLVGLDGWVMDFINTWTGCENSKGGAASDELYAWYLHLTEMISHLSEAETALQSVLDMMDDVNSARSEWGVSLGNVDDGEIKDGMTADYNNSAREVKPETVAPLKDVVIHNREHLSKIKETLEGIKYYDKQVCRDKTGVDYHNLFWDDIDKTIEKTDTFAILQGYAEDLIRDHYVTPELTFETASSVLTKIDETIDFYKYLKNTCTHGDSDEAEKSAQESNRDSLVEAGSSDPQVEDSYPSGSFLDGGLTPEIQEAIRSIAKGVDAGGENTFSADRPDSTGDDDMAKAGENNLDAVGSLLTSLGSIAEHARDYVYLEEYMTEMFSCGTTGKKNTSTLSLSGDDMSQNPRYGSEIEYLLYGLDTSDGNLAAARGVILGIRFALNCIFALTNSYTRTPALTAATAIAGWTGFGVPLVQTVILLAWALAESIVDVIDLCNGESVVVYKSSSTWVLGISGLKEKAVQWGETAVGYAFDWVQNMAMDQIDQLEGKIEQYIGDTVDGVAESVEGAIVTMLEGLIVQVVGETNYNLTQDDIKSRLENAIAEAKSAAPQDGSAASLALAEAYKFLEEGYLQDDNGASVKAIDFLAEKLYGFYSSAKEGVMAQISSAVSSLMDKIKEPLKNKINDAISSFGDTLKDKVSGIISEGGDMVKEKVSGAIGEYMSDMSGIEMPSADNPGASGKTSLAASFALSYKEYLKIFMMIGLMANKTNILARSADLIQLNVSSRSGAEDFNITEALTMIGINADIKVKTSFLDVPVSAGVDSSGNTTYELDFTKIGTGERIIHYKGIMGY